MANKVAFEVVVTSKGFKVVQQQQGKLAKNIEKTDKSTKNLDKTQQKNYGRQKQGLIQTANGTKNFSKLSQTINGGGGTSLVGAYATLAANIFAASAAFNALSRAAEFQKLREGLEIVGNQSGRTLSILADNLREATGMALTLEEASSAAAIGISGGFGEVELEGLAKVAKGAALTLGRSLPDAFDRLTRGAIKLEPEILDELGIMVRLDDAVEKYAAQLGKGVTSLTQMERRQAFMNEILVQGEAKFGDIAESADPTAYQLLGATFGDLTKTIFSFLNESTGLNAIVKFLADSTLALTGTMLIFGSTIATQIVPALGTMGTKAAARAADSLKEAQALKNSSKLEIIALENKRKAFKLGGSSYVKVVKGQEKGTNDLSASIKRLRVQENARIKGLNSQKQMTKTTIALRKAELVTIQEQIATERALQTARSQGTQKQIASKLAKVDAVFQKRSAQTMSSLTAGEISLGAALSRNTKELGKKGKRSIKALKNAGALTKANEGLKFAFKGVTSSLGILAAGFVKFLPIIGLVAVAIGGAMLLFNKFYNTAERKAYNKAFKELSTILDGLPDKAKAYNKALNSGGSAGSIQLRTSAILSNQITEINDKLKESIELREQLGKTGIQSSGIQMAAFSDQLQPGGDFTGVGLGTAGIDTAKEELAELEKLLNSKLPELATTSQTALATLFKVDQSVEVTALTKLLNSDIPAYAKTAADSLQPFSEALADGDAEAALKAASNIVDSLQKQFGNLNGAISGFVTSLQDAEKIASQFIQKFLPKTATSDLVASFDSFALGIISIREEAKRAFDGNIVDEFAAAFSNAGASVGSLLGGTFLKAQSEFNLAKEALDRANQDFTDAENKKVGAPSRLDAQVGQSKAQQRFDTAEQDLGTVGDVAFEKTRLNLIEINKLEVLRKGKLEEIKALRVVEKSIMGKSADAGKIQNKILDKTLNLRKENFTTGNKILANQLEITDSEIAENGLMGAIEDKLKNAVELKLTNKEITSINLQQQEAINIALQGQLNAAQSIANVGMAGIAVAQSTLKLQQREVSFSEKLRDVTLETEAIKAGRKTVDPISKLKAEIEAEKNKAEFAKEKARIELKSAEIQKNLLNAQIEAYASLKLLDDIVALDMITDNDNMFEGLETQLLLEVQKAGETAVPALKKAFGTLFGSDDLVSAGLQKSIMSAFLNASGGIETVNQQLIVAGSTLRDFGATMVDTFGEDGAVIGALSNFSATLVEIGPSIAASFAAIDAATIKGTGVFSEDGTEIMTKGISAQSAGLLKHAATAEMVSAVIGQLGAIMKADSDRRIAMVDQNIDAEKRLDGKSAGSLAKIAAMEKKKEALQRKSFETQKKIQMAQVIASTAAAVMQTMAASGVGFFATPLAMVVAAMGAAQLAIIKKTQFNGGSSEGPAVQNTALSIGGRGNQVDVSQGASAGETAYLRGAKGSGTSANNFTPGGAMGRKGYADGGMLVGERGPEVVTKEEIIPNYALGKGGTTNVNFTISAVDGQSVQNMLNDQQGNIIQMIRDAANDNGEGFLESVDPTVYNGSGG